MSRFLACLRRLQTWLLTTGKSRFLKTGKDLHVGRRTRLWAPHHLSIGRSVYIGKEVHIEANATIGDHCLIANRVAIIGRRSHDLRAVGYPIRFAPWDRSLTDPQHHFKEEAVIESDVWIGFGAIVLTGVVIGRGSVVAAGSVVAQDVPPYSIAAGVPARVVGTRFPDDGTRQIHEAMVASGQFVWSERGPAHVTAQPGPVPAGWMR